jgi:hypothetical protein
MHRNIKLVPLADPIPEEELESLRGPDKSAVSAAEELLGID